MVYVEASRLHASFVKDRAIRSFDAVGNHLLIDIESHSILADSGFSRIEIG
jgi:hypothetical protein